MYLYNSLWPLLKSNGLELTLKPVILPASFTYLELRNFLAYFFYVCLSIFGL